MNHATLEPLPTKTSWSRIGIVGVGLAALIGVILLAFLWPAVTAEPKDLPLAIAGPSQQVSAFEQGMSTHKPDLFAFSTAADRHGALQLIKTRQVYGAIVLAPTPEILVSSAANAVIAGVLGELAPALQASINSRQDSQSQPPQTPIVIAVTDVVPLASTDHNGVILSASAFPLVLGGLIGGVVISLSVFGIWRRLTALLVLSVVGGLGIAGIMQGWFGGLQGNYFANVGIIALALLAIGGVTIGLNGLIGRAGLAIGAALFLLFANPLSGATVPLEFIIRPWGAIGQWLPPGAAGTLFRNNSYFPDADSLFPWLVLFGWAIIGLVLGTVVHNRDRSARVVSVAATVPTADTVQAVGPAIATAP